MERKHIIGNRGSGKSLSLLFDAESTNSLVLANSEGHKRYLEELCREFDIDVEIISILSTRSLRGLNFDQYKDERGKVKLAVDESMYLLNELIEDKLEIPTKIMSVADTGDLEVRAGVYRGEESKEKDVSVLNIALGEENEWFQKLIN